MTNLEKIHMISAKEVVDFAINYIHCGDCPIYDFCHARMNKHCKDVWEEWLETEEELKPCPFCGEHLKKSPGDTKYVHPNNNCFLAHADTQTEQIYVCSDEIESWNRRCDTDD